MPIKFLKKLLGKKDDIYIPSTFRGAGLPQTPSPRFKQIAEIREVASYKDLPLATGKDVLLIDDFNHGDIDRYVKETINAEATWELQDGLGLDGKGLKVHYKLGLVQAHRAADLARKFIMHEGVQDWSGYSHLNFVIKVKKPTSILKVCVIDQDGDWWSFVNERLLLPDIWYWMKIPLREMYVLQDFSIQGNGVMDLDKVAEIRFLFDSIHMGSNLTENIVYLDQVFLSR